MKNNLITTDQVSRRSVQTVFKTVNTALLKLTVEEHMELNRELIKASIVEADNSWRNKTNKERKLLKRLKKEYKASLKTV